MVYMEPAALGWEPLLASWLGALPAGLAAHADLLGDLARCARGGRDARLQGTSGRAGPAEG